eukprot:m.86231 g.86231  ORF g.86231 m.86231 type:complete len:133 (-) comp25945_c0_seq2:414-812(-)
MLNAIEKLVESQPQLLSKVDKLCKTFYDLDILDEDTFLEWENNDTNAVMRNDTGDDRSAVSDAIVERQLHGKILARASEFLKWLRTAEEEDDDEVIVTDLNHDQAPVTSSTNEATTLSSRTQNCSKRERDMR